MYPADFKYSKEHEWIKVEGEIGTIGITDFAQSELGDVVYLELPEVGKKLTKQEVFGTIESVKAVSDLFCPVSGEVTEVNTTLVEGPEKLNEDPHGAAWLVKLKLDDAKDLDDLMSSGEYEAEIKK